MTLSNRPTRIDIWHNILWSKYKGEVFSSLYKINDKNEFDIRFFQIAETEGNRIGLASVNLDHHRYPFDLLFKGSLDEISFFRKLMAILIRTIHSDADLIILAGYEKPEIWIQMLILFLMRRKIAVFCDSTIYDQKQRFMRGLLKRIIFKSVHGIFGYGTRSKEYVLYYGANPQRVFYRCQAAALPLDYNSQQAMSSRLRSVPSVNAPRFLYVGRLSSEKGLDTLISAFEKVWKENQRASLVIIGNGTLYEKLEQQVRTLGIDQAVHFTGGKSGADLFNEYAQATAFILPSTSEPWGLVVNEALSYGCPVIVSYNCGCIPELVIEGKTGFVHRTSDASDLAAKMLIAPIHFSDIEKTTHDCLALMSNYTSDKAAEQIIVGCRAILKETKGNRQE